MKDIYVTGTDTAVPIMEWLSALTGPMDNVFLVDAITPRIVPQHIIQAGQLATMNWVAALADDMYYRLAGSDALIIIATAGESLHPNSAFEAGVMFAMRKPIALYTENEDSDELVLIPASLCSRFNAIIRGRQSMARFLESM
jgi:nucleoside 2-deoxyribosyltransferase